MILVFLELWLLLSSHHFYNLGLSKLGKPKSPEEIAREAELDRQRILAEAKARKDRQKEKKKSAKRRRRTKKTDAKFSR